MTPKDCCRRFVRTYRAWEERDKKVKEKIDAKNGLEGYLYNLKNTLEDDEKGLVSYFFAYVSNLFLFVLFFIFYF